MTSRPPLILTVDHNRRNLELLARFLESEGYGVTGAATLDELDTVLDTQLPVALALLDLMGFDPNIWLRCERLRKAGIPFLIISPKQSAAVQQASLEHGAHGVIIKPLVIKDLLRLIHMMLGA